jgi:phosphonatase-like hydrolase
MLSRRQSFKALAAAAAIQSSQRVASAAPPPLRLIVLDVGGTIIQDRGDVPEALQGAFAKRGIEITAEEIALWRGASKREVVWHFTGERSTAKGVEKDALVAAIYADFTARAIDAYKDVPPIAGAEAAFIELRRKGCLLASSTGFGREIAASIFHRLGWEKYFAAMITSDDVARGRPSPYMIFHAMEAARVGDVAEVMAVGDTPLDLQAGRNAGVRGVIGVLSGASKEEKLKPEPHTDILASVANLPALIAARY